MLPRHVARARGRRGHRSRRRRERGRASSPSSRRIHDHPELRFEEHQASAWLGEFVASHGHAVERGVAGHAHGLPCARARPRSPRVAILAEYDALPGVGHACGHNLIAAGAVGAFVAAARVAGAVGRRGRAPRARRPRRAAAARSR